MVLFGAVAPVSSDEVLAIRVQQLGVSSSGEISWDAVRDALIREITFGGAKCPTEEVCRLLADFLQRLPLPRLVHFLDMILPQMVPVQSPCQSRRRRFASSYRVAERAACGEWDVGYTLNVTKLYWSRSGIVHVAIAWDHKPLLLLATAFALLRLKVRLDPHMISSVFKWGCARAIQFSSVFGVELATSNVF